MKSVKLLSLIKFHKWACLIIINYLSFFLLFILLYAAISFVITFQMNLQILLIMDKLRTFIFLLLISIKSFCLSLRLIIYILDYFKFILHAFIFRVLFRSVWTFIRIIFRLNIAIISVRIIWFAKIFILIFHLFLVIAVIILIFLRCLIALVFWIFIISILWCVYFKDFIIFWIIIF